MKHSFINVIMESNYWLKSMYEILSLIRFGHLGLFSRLGTRSLNNVRSEISSRYLRLNISKDKSYGRIFEQMNCISRALTQKFPIDKCLIDIIPKSSMKFRNSPIKFSWLMFVPSIIKRFTVFRRVKTSFESSLKKSSI